MPESIKIRKCQYCGESIENRRVDAKFCSVRCKTLNYWQQRFNPLNKEKTIENNKPEVV